jgi:HSP20 family protein
MSLVKWDPFNLFKPSSLWADEDEASVKWMPTVDISENENELTFKAELPGVELKDITLSLDNNVLTIKGERRFEKETDKENYYRVERKYGNFSRSFGLPTFVDESKVRAEFKNGVLKIVLPKKEQAKSRGIEIKADWELF